MTSLARAPRVLGLAEALVAVAVVSLVVEWVLLTVRVMYRWLCREGAARGAVGGGVTRGADGDGAARRVDCEGCCSRAGVRCWWCDVPDRCEARGAVVRVAGNAVGEGGAAGGVSGGGALDDVDGEVLACDGPVDVGDGDGERAMAMLAMPMGGVLYGMQQGGRPWAMHRVVVVLVVSSARVLYGATGEGTAGAICCNC